MSTQCSTCGTDLLGSAACHNCIDRVMTEFKNLLFVYADSATLLSTDDRYDDVKTRAEYAQARSNLFNYVRPFFTYYVQRKEQ